MPATAWLTSRRRERRRPAAQHRSTTTRLAGLQSARDLDALADRLAGGDDALFDAIAVDARTRGRFRRRCEPPSPAPARPEPSSPARSARSQRSPASDRLAGLGTTASIVSARVSAATDGETKRTWPVKVSPGYASTSKVTGAAGGDRRYILLRHGELDAQRDRRASPMRPWCHA